MGKILRRPWNAQGKNKEQEFFIWFNKWGKNWISWWFEQQTITFPSVGDDGEEKEEKERESQNSKYDNKGATVGHDDGAAAIANVLGN